MTVKHTSDGFIRISGHVGYKPFKRAYSGYSEEEAKRRFKVEAVEEALNMVEPHERLEVYSSEDEFTVDFFVWDTEHPNYTGEPQ